MFDQKYTGIFRYPITTTLAEPSGNTQGPKSRPFGPIQYAGAFYCPAAERLLRGHRVPKTRDLLATAAWHTHDDKLRAMLPYLMAPTPAPSWPAPAADLVSEPSPRRTPKWNWSARLSKGACNAP